MLVVDEGWKVLGRIRELLAVSPSFFFQVHHKKKRGRPPLVLESPRTLPLKGGVLPQEGTAPPPFFPPSLARGGPGLARLRRESLASTRRLCSST